MRNLLNQGFLVDKYYFESFTVAIMSWLTVTEYLSKWSRIVPFVVIINHSLICSFVKYHWIFDTNNTMGATSGAGTTYPPGVPESNLFFVSFVLLNVFCVMFYIYHCLSFCTFLFLPLCCLYGFWLPLWHHQTLLIHSLFQYISIILDSCHRYSR
jgi:hypothetical protein